MRTVELRLVPETDEIHPLFDVMRGVGHAAIDRSSMLDWNVTRRETTMAMFRVVGDGETLEAILADAPVVREYEVTTGTETGDCYATMFTETTATEATLFRAFNQQRSLLVPPLEYANGGVTCRILGSDDELRAALAGVPNGVDVSVERLAGFDDPPVDHASVLTERQRTVVSAAIDVGYYTVPREATAAAVADRVDCTPSTASEHLRKAETRLVRAVLGD